MRLDAEPESESATRRIVSASYPLAATQGGGAMSSLGRVRSGLRRADVKPTRHRTSHQYSYACTHVSEKAVPPELSALVWASVTPLLGSRATGP